MYLYEIEFDVSLLNIKSEIIILEANPLLESKSWMLI